MESVKQRLTRINAAVTDSVDKFNAMLRATKAFPPEMAMLLQKKIAFDALRSLIKKTPVGNPDLWKNPKSAPSGYAGGHAKANWVVGIGTAPTTTTTNVDPDGGETETQGKAVLGFIPPYSIVFIVNNVDYIIWLEDGHSTQAPEGMLKLTLAEIQTQFMSSFGDVLE